MAGSPILPAPSPTSAAPPFAVFKRWDTTAARSEGSSAPPSFEELELREYLREWRRETAQEQRSPAYIVLHDTTLDEICRRVPQSIADLLQITGIGERKAEMFGQQVLDALTRFRAGSRATPLPPKKTLPAEETLRLLAEGRTFEDIAKIRSRQLTTVVNAVATLVESGQLEFDPLLDRRHPPIHHRSRLRPSRHRETQEPKRFPPARNHVR